MRVGEDVVEEKHRSLLGAQGLEQDEKCHRQVVGKFGGGGRVRCRVGGDRLGEPRAHVGLAAHPGRTLVVDRQSSGDRGEVCSRGLDAVESGPMCTQQRVLDDVLSVEAEPNS